MKVRRVIRSEGSGRTPGRWSTATISRRSRSSSDMCDISSRWIACFLWIFLDPLCRTSQICRTLHKECDLPARPSRLLLLQFDGQIRRLARRDSYRLLKGPGKRVDRHQVIVAGRDISNSELAVCAGDGVVGVVHHVDPPFHPAVSVAVDAHGPNPRQFRGNSLPLVRQRHVEGGALPVIAVGVVQYRVVVDDVQGTRADHLNLRLETAFAIVEFGRFASCRPCFSLGHLDQVHDRVLDALVGPNPDQRLVADAAAHLDILVRDDLPRRHRVVKDDLAVDLSAARNRAPFVGPRRYGDRPCEDNREEFSSQCEAFHGYPLLRTSAGEPSRGLTTNWAIREIENWPVGPRTKVRRRAGRSRRWTPPVRIAHRRWAKSGLQAVAQGAG